VSGEKINSVDAVAECIHGMPSDTGSICSNRPLRTRDRQALLRRICRPPVRWDDVADGAYGWWHQAWRATWYRTLRTRSGERPGWLASRDVRSEGCETGVLRRVENQISERPIPERLATAVAWFEADVVLST
jgi:hypothetical protein